MKKLVGLFLGLCLPICGPAAAFAQASSDQVTPPPKVLVIMREFLKPGKQGDIHQKSESAFVKAFADAKWPTHYFAAESLSGKSRTLFFARYDSFEAWEKDNLATQQNATLAAAIESAQQADGELLTSYDEGVFTYREDLSFHGAVAIAHMRYFEISHYVVRPGHGQEWEELVKEVRSAYEKSIPDAHWAIYQSRYGSENGGVFLVFTPMKSLAEVDSASADSKKFAAAVGETGMKKIEDMEASCIQSHQSNLFQFNPKMSYPPEAWIKADPEFWSAK